MFGLYPAVASVAYAAGNTGIGIFGLYIAAPSILYI
jgi:hypothetical protein